MANKYLTSEQMLAMKLETRERDRRLIESGELPVDQVFFIRPDMIKGATVDWGDASILSEPESVDPDLRQEFGEEGAVASDFDTDFARVSAEWDRRLAWLKEPVAGNRLRAIFDSQGRPRREPDAEEDA